MNKEKGEKKKNYGLSKHNYVVLWMFLEMTQNLLCAGCYLYEHMIIYFSEECGVKVKKWIIHSSFCSENLTCPAFHKTL